MVRAMLASKSRKHPFVPPFALTICGIFEFGGLDRRRFTHIVSIWHPSETTAERIRLIPEVFPRASVHSVIFDDIEEELPNFHPPKKEQIREVLDFGEGVGQGAHLLVHCMAGISRSTACAMAILARHSEPGSERPIAEYIQEIRPQAMPNRLVLAHADELLERDGALLGACDAVFGAPIGDPLINKGWE